MELARNGMAGVRTPNFRTEAMGLKREKREWISTWIIGAMTGEMIVES